MCGGRFCVLQYWKIWQWMLIGWGRNKRQLTHLVLRQSDRLLQRQTTAFSPRGFITHCTQGRSCGLDHGRHLAACVGADERGIVLAERIDHAEIFSGSFGSISRQRGRRQTSPTVRNANTEAYIKMEPQTRPGGVLGGERVLLTASSRCHIILTPYDDGEKP